MDKNEIMIDRKIITPEWIEVLPKAFEYFYDKIAPVIKAAAVDKIVYPEQINTFRAFKECKPKDVKVVILGQD